MIFNQLRRYTADAMNATGMQAGMPKVRVYASEVQQLLGRYDRLEAENARIKLLAQSAVDYYAVNSQHPSEAHDLLKEAINPTSTGEKR